MFSDIPPILFALAASLLFAIGSQFQNIGLARIEPRRGAEISIFATVVFFWLLAPVMLDGAHWSNPAVWIFVLVGLFRPSVSANLAVAAMRYLGPTLSSAMASVSPLFAAAFGVLLLAEDMTWTTALGTAGIISAVVMLAKRNAKIPVDWPLWALFLPIGAALVRSIGHVLTKIGMADIPDPYFAGLVGFITSGPIVAMAIEGNNVVGLVRNTVGATNPADSSPGTIRGDLGVDIGRNLIHGSDSNESAKRELSLFFSEGELLSYPRDTDRWIIEA